MKLINSDKLFALSVKNWWSQIKTAGSAIYVNRHYLALYRLHKPERLASPSSNKYQLIDDVYIHHSASIHPTAVVSCISSFIMLIIFRIRYSIISMISIYLNY
jgi:mannose-1-phosphate guanylyltransferase